MASLGRFLMLWSPQALLWAWTRGEHGEARLEAVGPRAVSIGGRPGQVGLQLGLQVLGEGGTEG